MFRFIGRVTKMNSKALFGIPVTIRVDVGFPAKIKTQPKRPVLSVNPTKFMFGSSWADSFPFSGEMNEYEN